MSLFMILLGVAAALVAYRTVDWRPNELRKRLWRIVVVLAVVYASVLLIRAGQVRLAVILAIAVAVVRWLSPTLVRLRSSSSSRHSKPASKRREARDATPKTVTTQMTRAEALEVLGLTEGATDEAVRDAYSALIRKVHPDQGGSAYLATRVNLARDRLLSK